MVLVTVKNEQRENLLTSAIEGGSNYWYTLLEKACDTIKKYNTRECFVDQMWDAILAGESIEVHDLENESELLGTINLASIEKGEQIMAEKYPQHFADVVGETDDAITADVWFQLAVMGELVFG